MMKVWLIVEDRAGYLDVVPGQVKETAGDTVTVLVDEETQPGLSLQQTVAVHRVDTFGSEPEALVVAVQRRHSAAAEWLACAGTLAARLR